MRLFTLLILTLIIVSPVFAGFNEDYQVFLRTYDLYRTQNDQYKATRQQYLNFQTLTSKNDAFLALKKFLTLRDEVLLQYLRLVLQRHPDSQFSDQIAKDLDFLNNHNQKINSLQTLEEAVSYSKQLEEKDLGLQTSSKKGVASILILETQSYLTRFNNLISETEKILEKLKSENKDVTTATYWSNEAKNKGKIANEKITLAKNALEIEVVSLYTLNDSYNKSLTKIKESSIDLKDGVKFLTELRDHLKYGQY